MPASALVAGIGQRSSQLTRTGCPAGTRLTIRLGAFDLDDRIAFAVLSGSPAGTGVTLWTRDRLCFPINREVRHLVICFRMPPIVLTQGTDQVQVVRCLTLDKVLCPDIASIHQVLDLRATPSELTEHGSTGELAHR